MQTVNPEVFRYCWFYLVLAGILLRASEFDRITRIVTVLPKKGMELTDKSVTRLAREGARQSPLFPADASFSLLELATNQSFSRAPDQGSGFGAVGR